MNLEEFELQRYTKEIESIAKACRVGRPSEHEIEGNYFGGLPLVDEGFSWPTNHGKPLSFVGQVCCREFTDLPTDDGRLLFFYDISRSGYSPKDSGHVCVLHQIGEREIEISEIPTFEVRRLFGLVKSNQHPQIYQKVPITFSSGMSLPSLDHELIRLENDVEEECYEELCWANRPDVQIGGFTRAIQSDDMEKYCVRATGLETTNEWVLLLQLFELGDMMWGDAGALYWFIHRDDLRDLRFDRIWMVTQCH